MTDPKRTFRTALLVAGVLAAAAGAAAPPADVGKPAPTFTLPDQSGKPVSLADYRGKVVVLEWINPDCPFSRRHHARRGMESLAEKYAARGVVWLGINSTHYWTTAKNAAWAKAQKLPYPILNDQSGDVGRAYGAKTTPDMRIIDAKGRIVYAGAIDDDPRGKNASPVNYVARALDELLAGRKVSTPKTRPYGCSVKYAPARPKAPPFTLTDHNGKKVSLADYAGKIVVLEWMNPKCPVSRRHYVQGTMKSLAERYAPKGVVWLAINSSHYATVASNRQWAEKYHLPYAILDDSAGKVGRAYDARTTPDMRVIDPTGHIVYAGAIDDDPRGNSKKKVNYVAKALDELLAGRKVSTPKTKPYGCSVKYARAK